ncbi:MAG: hypothetical protein JWL73_1900, partial [Actinomycetia bacterium]|nr:hypothetical protein [Actinomycetes bacterium]
MVEGATVVVVPGVVDVGPFRVVEGAVPRRDPEDEHA